MVTILIPTTGHAVAIFYCHRVTAESGLQGMCYSRGVDLCDSRGQTGIRDCRRLVDIPEDYSEAHALFYTGSHASCETSIMPATVPTSGDVAILGQRDTSLGRHITLDSKFH